MTSCSRSGSRSQRLIHTEIPNPPLQKGNADGARDLINYNEVLKNCRKGEPVFLTKNDRGRFVVMDIDDFERDHAEKKHFQFRLRTILFHKMPSYNYGHPYSHVTSHSRKKAVDIFEHAINQ